MRLTYRTQRRLRFAGLIAALLALLFIIAWFCSVVFLERYVVFTRDGAKLDTSFSANDVIGEVARPPVGDTGITIYYNEGADSVTLRTFSTTQMVEASRRGLAQISQTSVSDILWHTRQYFTSRRSRKMLSAIAATLFSSRESVCRAKRRAVLRPMPGSLANSLTARSKSREGYCSVVICAERKKLGAETEGFHAF